MLCSDTLLRRSSKAVKERPMSAPSKVASKDIFTQQSNEKIVKVRIENVPRGKGIQREAELPKNTTELRRSRRHIGVKTVRSSSLIENSFVSQNNIERSRSEPIIKTNLNEPEGRTTVKELTMKL